MKNNYLIFFSFIFLYSIGFVQAQTKVDSLEQILLNSTDIDQRLTTIQNVVDELHHTNWDKAFIYARQGVKEADAAKHSEFQPIFYEMLGRKFANSSKLDSARIFFEKAVDAYIQIGDDRGLATTHFKLGWLGRAETDLESAVEHDLQALRIMEKLNDPVGMASANARVAMNLYYQEDHEGSLKYALKAVKIGERNDIGTELPHCYVATGDAYLQMDEMEKSLEYYNKAYDLAVELNMQRDLTYFGNNQGNALKFLNRFDEAIEKYQEVLALTKELGMEDFYLSTPIANISHVYILKEEYEKALPYQLETLRMQEESDHDQNLEEAYLNTSQIYENLNDYKKAFVYKNKYHVLVDSTKSVQKDNALNELKIQYETEKKEAQIDQQQLQIVQQKRVQWLSIGTAVLLAILLSTLFYFYRKNQKNSKLLSEKSSQIEERNEQVEVLLKEIHHRVKNNLQVISSLLSFQSRSIKDKGIKTALLDSQSRVRSMSLIHQKLYRGKNLAAVEMKNYLGNLAEGLIDAYSDEDVISVELDMETFELDLDYAIPLGLIANELVTNSLKYAFPDERKGAIKIKLKQEKENLVLKIEDNGIGKIKNQIQATDSGFGSELIEMLSLQLKGKIVQSSEDGFYTQFRFPYAKVA